MPSPIAESDVRFNVVHNNKVVGILDAERHTVGSKVIYTNRSQVEMSIIKKIELVYETRVVFENGVMSESEVVTYINGKVRKTMATFYDGQCYKFYRNGKCIEVVNEPIRYSAIMMLFQEPVKRDRVYAEEAGCFVRIDRMGLALYSKVNGRGKTSSYYYSDGLLERMTIEGGFFDLEMVSVNEESSL